VARIIINTAFAKYVEKYLEREKTKKYLYWCNECLWEETMDEHKYDFCPECGHINISRKTNA
jgi:Zn finger protein HypA/HybF involved in hydrogenase expression